MFTKLFALFLVFSKYVIIKAELYQVNDTCANFPVEKVSEVIKEFFKNVSQISVFPLFTDWSMCIIKSRVFGDSLSYTTHDSPENYNKKLHLNIDGVLFVGIQEVKFSLTDHFIEKRISEKLAMMVVKGNVDQNFGLFQRALKNLFHLPIVVNIGEGTELTISVLDAENKVNYLNATDLARLDQKLENAKHFKKLNNQTFKVTMFLLESMERTYDDYVYDNPMVHLVSVPILDAMTRKLNLTPTNVGDYMNYGYRLPNGTLVGALGEIEYERADLANSRIIAPLSGTSNILFLAPFMVPRFMFVVPKNYFEHARRGVRVIALSPEFMAVYFSFLIWFPLGLQFFEYCRSKLMPFKNHTNASWISSLFATFAAMCNSSITIRETSSQRIYWITLIWFQLIVYSVFQGNMIKEVNMADNSRDIQTIQELMESPLNLSIDPSMEYFIKFKEEWVERYNLRNRFAPLEMVPEKILSLLISTRSFAALLDHDSINDLVPRFYDEQTGENLLHVVPEVAFEFYAAMYVPATSNYEEPFNRITMQFVENGLVNYGIGYQKFKSQLAYLKRYRNRDFTPSEIVMETVNFNALKPFFIAAVGLFALAITVFFIEVFVSWMFKQLRNVRQVKQCSCSTSLAHPLN